MTWILGSSPRMTKAGHRFYFMNIVHFYIASLFLGVILGLDPRIQVIMSHTVRAYCHSCAGRNRVQAVRAMRAVSEQLRILLLVTNHSIVTCQGNTMDPGLHRGDAGVWLGAIFYEHCATMSKSNFLGPIPACAGMTSF